MDNDSALDLVGAYEHGGSATLAGSFSAVEEVGAEYLDADVACAALAAAEIVAASFGQPSQGLDPEQAAELVTHREEVRRMPGIVARALTSLDAITRDPNSSELYGLWQEDGSQDDWLAAVNDLRNRLGASR